MLREQLRAYVDRTKLSQEEVAQLIGVKWGTFNSWIRTDQKPKQPRFASLIKHAERLLVSLDWLADRRGAVMWSDIALADMRAAIRRHALDNPPRVATWIERICELIRWTHRYDAKKFCLPIMAGAAHVKVPVMAPVLAGENILLPDNSVDYLADFWHLSAAWLLDGTGRPSTLDPTLYLPLLHAIEEQGITQETILRHAQILRQLQESYEGTRAPRE